MAKTRTVIRIAGRDYTINSAETEEYVRRVAEIVDRKMTELSLATHLPPAQLAVLVAVNATDELVKSQDEVRRLRRELDATRAELDTVKHSEET